MSERIHLLDLRRYTRQMLDRVRVQGGTLVVYECNTPQAALIPYDEYKDYRACSVCARTRASGPSLRAAWSR